MTLCSHRELAFWRLARVATAVTMSLWASSCGVERSHQDSVYTAEQVRKLPKHPLAQVAVKLRGKVTFLNSTFQRAFLQDATGGIRVENVTQLPKVAIGDTVEVTGTVIAGGPSPAVMRETIRVIPGGEPGPAVARPNERDWFTSSLQYRLVEVQGIVHWAGVDQRGRVVIEVRSNGRDVHATVRFPTGLDLGSLADSVVRLRGVIDMSMESPQSELAIKLFVPTARDVSVVVPAVSPAKIPLQTIRAAFDGSEVPAHRVRLSGSVAEDGKGYVLRDDTGSVRLRPDATVQLAAGD